MTLVYHLYLVFLAVMIGNGMQKVAVLFRVDNVFLPFQLNEKEKKKGISNNYKQFE